MILLYLKKLIIKTKLSLFLSKRRYNKIKKIIHPLEQKRTEDLKILEIGCAQGKDFIRHTNKQSYELYGVDITSYKDKHSDFTFVLTDASELPFKDNSFDLVVSIGMLEHIQPIEKLCQVISEIKRVGKYHIIIVPSISTFIEPHCAKILWQLQDKNKKNHYSNLNYYSDEAWLQFQGFNKSKTQRFKFIPLLINNLIICNIPE